MKNSMRVALILTGFLVAMEIPGFAQAAAMMNIVVANLMQQQVANQQAASRPPIHVAVAATVGETMGRPPTETELHDGINHVLNGGKMEELRTICATSPEAASNMAGKVKDATGKEATPQDINNGVQHIMTGGTITGWGTSMKNTGTSAIPNVDANLRGWIQTSSIDRAGKAFSNPSQTLGQ
jgi:hypothetical protein